MIRLGDGTTTSHERMQAAIDTLWMYTGEMFTVDAVDESLIARRRRGRSAPPRSPWRSHVEAILDEATLAAPSGVFMQGGQGRGGRQGVHTEHFGHLLPEMQYLQRAYPEAQW